MRIIKLLLMSLAYILGTVVGVVLSPILVLYFILKRKDRVKCKGCGRYTNELTYNGLCAACKRDVDELMETLEDMVEEYPSDEGVPWMSIEVVPEGAEYKGFANIDIRIDGDTGLPHLFTNDEFHSIVGSDGYAL